MKTWKVKNQISRPGKVLENENQENVLEKSWKFLTNTDEIIVTTDVFQPWTNYVNNGNKHLIVGADVRSEYSNIQYLHLIIGKAQKFVSGDKYNF